MKKLFNFFLDSLPWNIVWGIIGVIVPRREMCVLLWMGVIAVQVRPVREPGIMVTGVVFGFRGPRIVPLSIIIFLYATLFHYRRHLSPRIDFEISISTLVKQLFKSYLCVYKISPKIQNVNCETYFSKLLHSQMITFLICINEYNSVLKLYQSYRWAGRDSAVGYVTLVASARAFG